MAKEFEFEDLSDAVFWGVDLHRARFRDVDLSGARISHARLVDVAVDAHIDRLVINGVDVTDYVNGRDQWFALRSQLEAAEPDGLQAGWRDLTAAWELAVDRARALPDEQRRASVDGEWSFVQTLRHLVFATDKWFTAPVGGGGFDPMGLPNSGSVDFGWPGLDRSADPTFEEAVQTWRDRAGRLRHFLHDVTRDALQPDVEVLENGANAVGDCIRVVLEEHFQHLRYATRDLDRLTSPPA